MKKLSIFISRSAAPCRRTAEHARPPFRQPAPPLSSPTPAGSPLPPSPSHPHRSSRPTPAALPLQLLRPAVASSQSPCAKEPATREGGGHRRRRRRPFCSTIWQTTLPLGGFMQGEPSRCRTPCSLDPEAEALPFVLT